MSAERPDIHVVSPPPQQLSRRAFLLGTLTGVGGTVALGLGISRFPRPSENPSTAGLTSLETPAAALPVPTSTPEPSITLADEGPILPEGAELLGQKEWAIVAKRVDDFTYIAEEFIQEPFRAGLFRRIREIPDSDLSALMGATHPREASSHANFTIVDENRRRRYVLDVTNKYYVEELLKSSIQLNLDLARNPEVRGFLDGSGKVVKERLTEFANTVFRVPDYASWGQYSVRIEGRDLDLIRAGGVSPKGRVISLEVNAVGQCALNMEDPFVRQRARE